MKCANHDKDNCNKCKLRLKWITNKIQSNAIQFIGWENKEELIPIIACECGVIYKPTIDDKRFSKFIN